jgi:oxygen-independent coproporphyrinogen-3 oxidase
MGVDQVSTYPLMRFGYTPFGTASHDRRKEHAVLADVTDLARSMGYERRSVWTFNRRGAPAYTSITRRRFLGMGAGSSSFAGRDFYVNHFGVTAYAEAVEGDRLPIARWLHLGPWAGAAYDAFWQAYSGRIDPRGLDRSFGSSVGGCARAGLATLSLAGLLRSEPDGYHLTSRGYSAYHDLERLVTYQLIEPLWAEMLTEHRTSPDTGVACADWAAPERARSSRAWSAISRLFERRPRDDGALGDPASSAASASAATADLPSRQPAQ